jgi:hypothetical protein
MIFGKLRGYKKVPKLDIPVSPKSPVFNKLIDLIHEYEIAATSRNAHNMWATIYKAEPVLTGKVVHVSYSCITQELSLREGSSEDWKVSQHVWVKTTLPISYM